jgi:hypothetical protein
MEKKKCEFPLLSVLSVRSVVDFWQTVSCTRGARHHPNRTNVTAIFPEKHTSTSAPACRTR